MCPGHPLASSFSCAPHAWLQAGDCLVIGPGSEQSLEKHGREGDGWEEVVLSIVTYADL